MVRQAGATFATPPALPKLKIGRGDPPVPLKTQGSRKLSPASVIWVGKPLWCLDTRGACTIGPPQQNRIGIMARGSPAPSA
ncbi:hypothetical protein E2C01_009571 [Portunus trituberculatus]|uniref:Uncharacterized protein n=1 Tax=Portunus trituberculatus TaxID=210409 RepID=A0A5B7D6C9_PORTR|nr:hypothetical protein [Portunus trituberculatus]